MLAGFPRTAHGTPGAGPSVSAVVVRPLLGVSEEGVAFPLATCRDQRLCFVTFRDLETGAPVLRVKRTCEDNGTEPCRALVPLGSGKRRHWDLFNGRTCTEHFSSKHHCLQEVSFQKTVLFVTTALILLVHSQGSDFFFHFPLSEEEDNIFRMLKRNG